MSGSTFEWPKGQSRYAVLANELGKQIKSGKYKTGDFIPTEVRLCETYGVSRFTARQAVQELKKQGLVIRSRLRGDQPQTVGRRVRLFV